MLVCRRLCCHQCCIRLHSTAGVASQTKYQTLTLVPVVPGNQTKLEFAYIYKMQVESSGQIAEGGQWLRCEAFPSQDPGDSLETDRTKTHTRARLAKQRALLPTGCPYTTVGSPAKPARGRRLSHHSAPVRALNCVSTSQRAAPYQAPDSVRRAEGFS